jgi:hypothetical protein
MMLILEQKHGQIFSKMIKAIIYLNILLGPVLTIGPGPNIDFN